MLTQSTHYQHSGKAPLGGVLLTLMGGITGGVILGAVYGFLIYWSPFVYVNAFITFGFGVGLAALVGALGAVGKIRNTTVVTVVALIVALAAYYAHWVVWAERMTETRTYAPAELWQFISAIAAMGPWAIFDWTPTGTALWLIWGVEALAIVGLTTISAHGGIDVPFCEATGQWATETALETAFQPIDVNRSIDTPQSLLDALQPMTDPSNAFTQVTVATADGSELRCVSLKAMEVEQKDDKEEIKETEIVRNMLFDRDTFEKLMGLAKLTMA